MRGPPSGVGEIGSREDSYISITHDLPISYHPDTSDVPVSSAFILAQAVTVNIRDITYFADGPR